MKRDGGDESERLVIIARLVLEGSQAIVITCCSLVNSFASQAIARSFAMAFSFSAAASTREGWHLISSVPSRCNRSARQNNPTQTLHSNSRSASLEVTFELRTAGRVRPMLV